MTHKVQKTRKRREEEGGKREEKGRKRKKKKEGGKKKKEEGHCNSGGTVTVIKHSEPLSALARDVRTAREKKICTAANFEQSLICTADFCSDNTKVWFQISFKTEVSSWRKRLELRAYFRSSGGMSFAAFPFLNLLKTCFISGADGGAMLIWWCSEMVRSDWRNSGGLS